MESIFYIDSVNNSLRGVSCPPQSYVGFYGQDKLNNLITYKLGAHANPIDPPSNRLYKKTTLDNFVHCNSDDLENYFNSELDNPDFPDFSDAPSNKSKIKIKLNHGNTEFDNYMKYILKDGLKLEANHPYDPTNKICDYGYILQLDPNGDVSDPFNNSNKYYNYTCEPCPGLDPNAIVNGVPISKTHCGFINADLNEFSNDELFRALTITHDFNLGSISRYSISRYERQQIQLKKRPRKIQINTW